MSERNYSTRKKNTSTITPVHSDNEVDYSGEDSDCDKSLNSSASTHESAHEVASENLQANIRGSYLQDHISSSSDTGHELRTSSNQINLNTTNNFKIQQNVNKNMNMSTNTTTTMNVNEINVSSTNTKNIKNIKNNIVHNMSMGTAGEMRTQQLNTISLSSPLSIHQNVL